MNCFYERYIQLGGLGGTMSEARQAELLALHREHHATTCRTRCRACGAANCAKPECFRAVLAAHGDSARQQRLARHAAEAARDAAMRQNGHVPR